MVKLITWERNNSQFHPNVSAVSFKVWLKVAAAKNVRFIIERQCSNIAALNSVSEVERVKHNRLGESDRQDRLHQNRCGCARIASDCRRRAQPCQADADAAAQRRKTNVNVSDVSS